MYARTQLKISKNLQKISNSYSLASKQKWISDDMLNPYRKSMMKELGINSGKVKNIISNFHSKEKHLLHAAAWRETEK